MGNYLLDVVSDAADPLGLLTQMRIREGDDTSTIHYTVIIDENDLPE